MKSILHLLTLALLLPTLWAPLVAQEHFYSTQAQSSDKMLPASGGFVLMGATETYGNSVNVLKINKNGVQQWVRNIPAPDPDYRYYNTYRGITTTQGGFMMANLGWQESDLSHHLIVQKLNAGGHLMWSKDTNVPIYFFNNYYVTNIIEATGGGFLITGFKSGSQGQESWVARVDTNGNLLWWNFYTEQTQAWSAINRPGGGFAVVGDLKILLLDADGNVDEEVAINLPNAPNGDSYSSEGRERIIPVSETEFVVVGTAVSASYEYYAIAFARYSWADGLQTVAKFSEVDNFVEPYPSVRCMSACVLPGSDTELMIAYTYFDMTFWEPLSMQIRGIRINLDGDILETGVIQNSLYFPYYADFVYANGKYAFGGTALYNNPPDFQLGMYANLKNALPLSVAPPVDDRSASAAAHDPRVAVTLPDGSTLRLPEVIAQLLTFRNKEAFAPLAVTSDDYQIAPNPTTGVVTLLANATTSAQVRVFDPKGRLVLETQLPGEKNALPLDLSNEPAGVYFVEITPAAPEASRVVRKVFKN